VSVSELPWAPPAVELQSPGGIAIAANGDVYYADSVHDVIRRLDSRGRVEALSATLGRVVERPRGMTPFDAPGGMALAPDGGLIIADSEHDRVLRLDLATGLLSVVAGVGERGFGGDGGPAMEALFDTPTAVAAAPNGDLYVADTGNHRVRKVEAASGLVSTFAGNGETGDVWSVGDWGPAVEATLDGPSDVALGPEGEVYIADMRLNRVRRVGPEGEITTVAGCGAFAAWGDGWPAPTAALAGPAGIAVAAGRDGVTLYIADYYNGRVRMVGPDGAMRTLQGSRVKAFDAPTRVAWSPRGWLYVADATRNRVTVVRAPRAAPG
jgi:DNA-binding beta-propeller fold protein YncE